MEFVARRGWGHAPSPVPPDAERALDILFAKFTVYRQSLNSPKIVKEEDLKKLIDEVKLEVSQ